MPLVSIVLPTKNRASMLPYAIDAILAQEFSDWELIVVDDGSDDTTPSVIADYQARDARIRSIRNEPSRRLPAALNRGFEEARGEFLTWTSDDNLHYPHALTVLVGALQSHPEAGLAYTSMDWIDDRGEFMRHWAAEPPETQPLLPWVGACFLYRKSLADRVGGYATDLFLAEDFDYWVRCRLAGPMVVCPERCYAYRIHDQSLSAQREFDARQVAAQVAERYVNQASWLTRRTRAETHLGIAEAALRRGDRRALRKHLIEALRGCPDLVVKRFKRGLVAALRP